MRSTQLSNATVTDRCRQPKIDAAGQALNFREPLAAEPARDLEASSAVMAVDDDLARFVGFEFADRGHEFAHRNSFALSMCTVWYSSASRQSSSRNSRRRRASP